jgi:glycosyltransferase involved in cell wall biosynthesis
MSDILPIKRILYYYNISNSAAPEADSGPIAIYHTIKRLLKWNPTWHFYCVLPEGALFPKDPRVTPIYIPFDSYNMLGRVGFDLHNLKDAIKINEYDYDLIYNNQPEISPGIFILLNNHPRITYSIPILNHIHWFVSPDNYMGNAGENMQTCNEPVTHQTLVGMLCGQATGVDSLWAKEFILKEAERFITKDKIEYLRKTIFSLNPGVDIEEIDSYRTDKRFDKFTIIWNSRLTSYTGATLFFEFLDRMWDEGYRDFQVICTNIVYKVFADKRISKYDYVKLMDRMPLDEYYKVCWMADCGVFMHIGWGAWSIASCELMACHKPIVSISTRSAPEIFGEDYPLYFARSSEDNSAYRGFRRKMLKLMKDHEYAKKVGDMNRKRCEENFHWDKTVKAWDEMIHRFGDFNLSNGPSEGKIKLLEFVKKKGTATKKEVLKQFGGAISYTRYRRYLLTHGIYDDYTKSDALYCSEMPEGGFKSSKQEMDDLF